MYPQLQKTILALTAEISQIEVERKTVLQPLVDFLQRKSVSNQVSLLNFICTHNSRRSQLAQIWAQVAAAAYGVENVYTYSGGTETTAIYPEIVETLSQQGLKTMLLSGSENPVLAFKFSEVKPPIVVFSKVYDHAFNPASAFVAVMTCTQADGDCPFVAGAEQRIAIPYTDPKFSDGTIQEGSVYAKTSLAIAAEMFYVFSQIKPSIQKEYDAD